MDEKVLARKPWGLGQALWGIGLGLGLSAVVALGVIIVSVITHIQLPSDQLLAQVQKDAISPVSILLSLLALWTGFFLSSRAAVSLSGDGWGKTLGLSFKRRDVLWGLLVAVIGLGLELLIINLYAFAGGNPEGFSNTSPITDNSKSLLLPLILMGTALGAPFFEELFFRGLLLRALVKKWGSTLAVIISSVCFGLMHWNLTAEGTVLILLTGALGATFAIISLKTGRLGINIFAHVFFNTFGVILALM